MQTQKQKKWYNKLWGNKLTKRQVCNGIKQLVALTIVFIILIWIVGEGLDRDLVAYCSKLKSQSENYSHFYLTPKEKKMCDYAGIEINAPISQGYVY